jgi:hypothetical protein
MRWHCSRACALASRNNGAGAPGATAPEPCDHVGTFRDEDGQVHCLVCGRAKGPSPKVNGFDALFALMVTDVDGQYRRKGHRLRYGDLDHLRTRLVPRNVELPSTPRACASCGCYLRRGRIGSLCEPCAASREAVQ